MEMASAAVTERDASLADKIASTVHDLPGLEDACWMLCAHLGFDYIEFSFRSALGQLEEPPTVHVSNFPASWREAYRAKGLRRVDPVLRSAFQGSAEPVFWNLGAPMSREEREVLEQAAAHGVNIALSHAIPGHHGEICLVVFGAKCGTLPLPGLVPAAGSSRASLLTGPVNLGFRVRGFLSILYQVALRLRQDKNLKLSSRERAVLGLVKSGGSTESISRALGITPRTVYEYLATAGRKLGLAGRHRIAQRALEMGLLDSRTFASDSILANEAITEAAEGRGARRAPASSRAPIGHERRSHPAGERYEWTELRKRTDELSLVYQPIVSARHRIPVSSEALLRWTQPGSSAYLSPSNFIPRLEQTGAIIEVGLWAIRQVLDQLRRWKALSSPFHMSASVNVSPLQIEQPNFADSVLSMLRVAKVGSDQLVLEITESRPINWGNGSALANLEKLHERGIRVYLDDFGSGHASINNLYRARFIHGVKIDSSLVLEIDREPRVAVIVRSIAKLATEMGLQVIGEGVENEQQLELLQELGVDHVQGFLFSEGVAGDLFLGWCRRQIREEARISGGPGDKTLSGGFKYQTKIAS